MNWKYYIPHEWLEGDEPNWQDIFVLPDDPCYTGDALWITIDCAVKKPADDSDEDWVENYEKQQQVLGDKAYCIVSESYNEDTNMIVAQSSFTIDEFLDFVKIWIAAQGFPVIDLVPAPIEQFSGRCSHADLVNELQNI